MEWSDTGLILGTRRHGEGSLVLELMTRAHGRHFGLVHGGRSKRVAPLLQPGNEVEATWRARLDEHLGYYAVEAATTRAAKLIGSPLALFGFAALASHLRLLPERDPHPNLYGMASILAEHLDDPDIAPALLVRFEVTLLTELGFGLDLAACAATGQRDDLAYVSPKSGRAVSAEAGEPYRTRLLPLPAFLVAPAFDASPPRADIARGFALTTFFLRQHVYEPRGQRDPEERARFVALATDCGAAQAADASRPVTNS